MNGGFSFAPGVAVVAGGSGGLGAAVAARFAEAGVPVVVTYHRNDTAAEKLCAEIESAGGQCAARRCDLTRAAEVDELLSWAASTYGRVGQVVYAAGPSFGFAYIGEIPDDDWHRVVDTDINGAFHLIQAAVRTFRAQGDGGNLVALITSATGRVAASDIMSAGPKAAIEMLVKGVAKESGRFGIRANCVGPGWIDAGLGRTALDNELTEQQRQRITAEYIPLRRIGVADDVAWAVLYLCSEQANFVTGQSLAVDGGAQI